MIGVLLIVLLIIFGIDYYAFTGLKSLLSGSELRWRRIATIAYGITSLCTLAGFALLVIASQTTSHSLYLWATGLLSWAMALMLGKLIWIGFLLGSDLWTLAERGIAMSQGKSAPVSDSRRKFIAQVGLTVASLPFASMAYGILKGKYDYQLRKLNFTHPDLPEAFDGFTIVQLSDIHSGSFDNQRAVARGVELAMQQQADLIVFTGDLINREAAEFTPWRETFAALNAPYGMYSTMGNHDYPDHKPESEWQAHLDEMAAHHEAVGFQLLNNAHVNLEKEGQHISLIGVENWGEPPFPQLGDLDKALKGTEASPFRILLSHDPTHFDHKVVPHPTHIHLTLAGHTHGMQFGVETEGFRWSPVKYRYPKWAGRYDAEGRTLYVNRGFGFIGFSGRVGIWPEVTLITLRKA